MRGLLAALVPEIRASPELPSADLVNPDPWLWEALGHEQTWTDTPLSKPGSFRLSVVYACINTISQDLSRIPQPTMRAMPGGGREKARDHPTWELTRGWANLEQTILQFRLVQMAHVLGWGNAYSRIQRVNDEDPTSQATARWLLDPDHTEARRVRGVKVLVTWPQDGDGRPVALLPGEYSHVAGLGYDGLKGYSPLQIAKQSIALGLAREEYMARFYGNNATPRGWVSHPLIPIGPKGKEQKDTILRQLAEDYGGLRRAHSPGVLWGGGSWIPSGISPEDQELVASSKLTAVDICGIYRVPPVKVARVEQAATYGSVEQQDIGYVRDALMFWAVQMEQVDNRDLITPADRPTIFTRFDFSEMLRGDAKSEAEALTKLAGGPIMTRAEAREKRGLNPIDDPGAGELLQPVNMMTASQAGTPEPSTDALERSREMVGLAAWPHRRQHRALVGKRSQRTRQRLQRLQIPVYTRAAERWVLQEIRALERALSRSDDLAGFDARAEEIWLGLPDAVRRELLPVLLTHGGLVLDAIDEELGAEGDRSWLDVFAVEQADGAARRHITSSRGQIAGLAVVGLAWEEIRDAVAGRLGEWGERRASKIGHGEPVRATGVFSMEGYARGGVERKVWRNTGASCPLCLSLEGQTAEIRGSFLRPGDTVEPVGDTATAPLEIDRVIRHAPLHGKCDCVISPA